MSWKLDSDRPIYSQIVERLQIQIASGHYAPGERLPSVRELAAEAGVNPNTMQRAFAELEQYRLITTQRTSGRSVTLEAATIRHLQKELAAGHIKAFLTRMQELGFPREEVMGLLAEELAAENKTYHNNAPAQ